MRLLALRAISIHQKVLGFDNALFYSVQSFLYFLVQRLNCQQTEYADTSMSLEILLCGNLRTLFSSHMMMYYRFAA